MFTKTWIMITLVFLLSGAILFYTFRDEFKSPAQLYLEAQEASPKRAVQLYERLGEKKPIIQEYANLWAAEETLHDPDTFDGLWSITASYPLSPAAYQAYIVIARQNSDLYPFVSESAYRQALELDDKPALRLELARFLEENGDLDKAYIEYRNLLKDVPDSFEGMRRTGQDPVLVAEDLIKATYFSDALEMLQDKDHPNGTFLSAKALYGLQRYEEAGDAYSEWLGKNPDDTPAQMGLASVYVQLGRTGEAKEIYEEINTNDSLLELARLSEEDDPDLALAFYLESPFPVAWWNATWILEEQGRLEEALPLYRQIAEAGTYYSDDAAYRLYILSTKLGDDETRSEARSLLEMIGPNWLEHRIAESGLEIDNDNKIYPVGEHVFDKVELLDSLGRQDLADAELLFAAKFLDDPFLKSTFLEELQSRGNIAETHALAEAYIESNPNAPINFWRLSYPMPYQEIVKSAAEEFGVDPLLIWAVMRVESRYDPDAMSYVGARGLMQILPSTQDWITEQMEIELQPGDAYKPEENIRMGSWYLKYLMDYFNDDLELAIMAYNGGFANVEEWRADPLVSNREDLIRWTWFGETREYLQKVMLDYLVYQELSSEELGL
ncbi:transglycosylase SLT domain-containing protein [Chloroflexota bacterium]